MYFKFGFPDTQDSENVSGDKSVTTADWLPEMEKTVSSCARKNRDHAMIHNRNPRKDRESRKAELVANILQIADAGARAGAIYMIAAYFDELRRDDQITVIDESIRIFAETGNDADSDLASVAACLMTNLETYFLPDHFFALLQAVEASPRLMNILYRSHNFLSHDLSVKSPLGGVP